MKWTGPALAAGIAALLAACGDARLSASAKPSGGCSSCHGGAQNPAPPFALSGATVTTEVAVGAHQLHLRDTPIRSAIPCAECHLVPAAADSPGHLDSSPAEVTFGPLATHGGAAMPSWTRSPDARCSGVYCHGATMRSPPPQGPTWTFAQEPDPGRPGICATCHGWPPPAPHAQLTGCNGCHGQTVLADATIDLLGGKHVDGVLQVTVSGGCAGCHGYPPATGAHAIHFGLTGVAASGSYGDLTVLQDRYPAATPVTAPAVYAFGCGHCHPLDAAKHLDGTVEVEVQDAAAPAGSLKARSAPAAAYSGGACSGVYCHSSGQESPSWSKPYGGPAIASPGWNSGLSLGCNGCHDDPPAYPSGGAGAVDANSHVGLADDGYEFGHFGGLPGPFHSSKHGGDSWGPSDDAAPMTCQMCHAATVDPANTGPSGFYYLDTNGAYQLPAGLLGYACASCHLPGDPTKPTGGGRTLPLRHVNGTREVVFDARATIGAISWLPAAPNTPTRPYWVTNAMPGSGLPTGAIYDGATMSLHLQGTAYDPATKTCSAAACHLEQTSVRWGRPYEYLSSGPNFACGLCHCTIYGAGPCPPPP
jgi:predicted CxxxxCH...CXXCH cytochrome family protein